MNTLKDTVSHEKKRELADKIRYTELVMDEWSASTIFKKPAGPNYAVVNCLVLEEGAGLDAELKDLESCIPAPEPIVRANEEAIAYIEESIGETSGGDLYFMKDDHESPLLGYSTATLGHIATRGLYETNATVWGLRIRSHLVHEQAHSTATQTSKNVVISRVSQDDDGVFVHSLKNGYVHGMIKTRVKHSKNTGDVSIERCGDYLEEAFAEEAASRYRAEQYENPDALHYLVYPDGSRRALPRKYIVIDENDVFGDFYSSNSMYPAYLISKLSERCGVDIYDLMVRSRDPRYEVEAKRQIAQALESIQKGLYKKLRDLPYPYLDEEFFKTYDELMALAEPSEETEEAVA